MVGNAWARHRCLSAGRGEDAVGGRGRAHRFHRASEAQGAPGLAQRIAQKDGGGRKPRSWESWHPACRPSLHQPRRRPPSHPSSGKPLKPRRCLGGHDLRDHKPEASQLVASQRAQTCHTHHARPAGGYLVGPRLCCSPCPSVHGMAYSQSTSQRAPRSRQMGQAVISPQRISIGNPKRCVPKQLLHPASGMVAEPGGREVW